MTQDARLKEFEKPSEVPKECGYPYFHTHQTMGAYLSSTSAYASSSFTLYCNDECSFALKNGTCMWDRLKEKMEEGI